MKTRMGHYQWGINGTSTHGKRGRLEIWSWEESEPSLVGPDLTIDGTVIQLLNFLRSERAKELAEGKIMEIIIDYPSDITENEKNYFERKCNEMKIYASGSPLFGGKNQDTGS